MSNRRPVLVVDYGVGNLLSVTRALDACGGAVELSGEAARLRAAERVVLPGVGAFGDCMVELTRRGLVAPLLDYARAGRPLLGICVGMQYLMEIGEEFGEHDGLGLIPGRVRRIPRVGADGAPHKIPHIGWSALVPPAGASWSGTLLADVAPGDSAYFVHSFTAEPVDPAHRLADCDYDGCRVAAAIHRGAIAGCQFHPEKSGPVGLRILQRFLAA